jgi:hypothetical protein
VRARKFAENAYYHELSRELRTFGYRVRNRARGDFEIEGVSEELCERFSKRHTQIDEALAKLLADKPELTGGNFQDLRELLATTERSRRQKTLSRDELRRLWEAQLNGTEQIALRQLANSPGKDVKQEMRVKVSEAVQWAEEHLFDRNSVVLECQLWQEALGRARGGELFGFRTQGFHGLEFCSTRAGGATAPVWPERGRSHAATSPSRGDGEGRISFANDGRQFSHQA